MNNYDLVPADYRPSCIECEIYVMCPLPAKMIEKVKTLLSMAVLISMLKEESSDDFDIDQETEKAIDKIQAEVNETPLKDSPSSIKLINFLRLINYADIQKRAGDETLMKTIIMAAGEYDE